MDTSKPSRFQRLIALGLAIAAPAGAVVLYKAPPTEDSFYPRCMFHTLTGLHCPGCGATRCLYALVHGDLRQAAAYNLLFLLAVPVLAYGGALLWWSLFTGRPTPTWRVPRWGLWALLGVVLVFWVVRNLGFPPFSWLAPHELGAG